MTQSYSEETQQVAKTKPDSGEKLFRVLPRQVDQTISAALREWLPGKSWSEVRQLLKSRRVTINGNLCVDAGRRLRLTDVVKLLPQSIAPPPDELDIRIVYLDKHVVVVEKPAGMTTTRHSEEQDMSPRRRQLQPTLDELIPRAIAKIEAREEGERRDQKGKKGAKRGVRQVRAVHRLDRDTSGLVGLCAEPRRPRCTWNTSSARTAPSGDTWRWRAAPSSRKRSRAGWSAIAATAAAAAPRCRTSASRAVTHVRAVERLGDYTLIECRLETGRTHQIRIHLSESGHPLCGDKVYGQPLFRRRRARHERRAAIGPLCGRVGLRASGDRRADALREPSAARFCRVSCGDCVVPAESRASSPLKKGTGSEPSSEHRWGKRA